MTIYLFFSRSQFAFFPKRMLIDDDSLLSVIQIFVNEFLIVFDQNLLSEVQIFIFSLESLTLGPIDAFSNLKLRIHNSNLMTRIHIFTLNAKHQSFKVYICFRFQSILGDSSPKARADGHLIVSTKVIIKLIGLLGLIDLLSLFDNFIEAFNGPWRL